MLSSSVLLLFVCVGWEVVEGVSFQEDVRITFEQKQSIDKLRRRVEPYIVEDYMKEDIHLVKWLRATDFDVNLAERKLIENIKWRKENRLATIDQEDFTDIAETYPYMNSGYDKEGRPVFIAFAGEWDIRGGIVTGRINRIFRYLYKSVEVVARRVRCLQGEGHNVTQAILIIDLEQFNLVQHACVRCVVRIVEALHLYENYMPGLADKLILINAPPAVYAVIEVARQAMSRETRAALKVFGTNKAQWKEYLNKYIDRKYLPVEMGGIIQRD